MPHPVDGGDEDAVGDGVGPLHGAPRVVLGGPFGAALGRVPADGARIDDEVRAAQRAQPGGLGKPLVPADQGADPREPRLEDGVAEVAGREVELLVVERIVGDVGLAVAAQQGAVGVDDRDRVVVDAGRPPLEDGNQQHDVEVGGEGGAPGGGRPGHRLGELEVGRVLALAEVAGAEELLQADDLGAPRRRLTDQADRGLDVGGRGVAAGHLHQADREPRSLRGRHRAPERPVVR